MGKRLRQFIDDLWFWTKIYTWKEFWQLMAYPFGVVGIWWLFCAMLRIPWDWLRATVIWTLMFLLSLGAGVKEEVERHRGF